jgi:hypothetical protein
MMMMKNFIFLPLCSGEKATLHVKEKVPCQFEICALLGDYAVFSSSTFQDNLSVLSSRV